MCVADMSTVMSRTPKSQHHWSSETFLRGGSARQQDALMYKLEC